MSLLYMCPSEIRSNKHSFARTISIDDTDAFTRSVLMIIIIAFIID